MQLDWVKCGEDWCPLNTVDLSHSHFEGREGVYIIWHSGDNPAVVRVGQGIIKDRLAAHRIDKQIQAFAHLGLYATWASVSQQYRDGVEAFLFNRLSPKVGERCPDSPQISVNLPW